jgi:hypothetical protein
MLLHLDICWTWAHVLTFALLMNRLFLLWMILSPSSGNPYHLIITLGFPTIYKKIFIIYFTITSPGLRGIFSNAISTYTSTPTHPLQHFWLSYLHLTSVHLFLLSISTSLGIIGLLAITLDIFYLTPNVIQVIVTHSC